jgi:DNA segregation ATPase FtsK/SpoIIIE-like protein
MPRVLSVSEVRKHLYWAAGGPEGAGAGEPTIALLGTVFHQLFGQLTGPDPRLNLVAPLQLADADLAAWQKALLAHAYVSCIAPAFAAHQAGLQARSNEVVAFWAAVRSLCDWLAALLFEQRGDDEPLEAMRARTFAVAEEEVSAELSDPAWTDAVLVQGRADAIFAQRGTDRRCVVELKLGRTVPEADLLQASLYHLLLAARGQPATHLALVAFEPQRREHLFAAQQLEAAQAALKALVWRLAGGDTPAAAPAPRLPERPPTPLPDTDLAAIGRKLEAAFAEFGAPIELQGDAIAGPTFIRFLARPKRGVTVRSLTRLAESVCTRLETSEPPQIALHRGRIAIDVERPQRQQVLFADWRDEMPARQRAGESRFAVGITVDGRLHLADLARPESAHFLVAGTSGSGKTEWLRAAIASLLASNAPATLRLALIDPKRTAFGALQASPYLLQPLVYSEGVEALLDGLIDEMEQRYARLAAARVDDLAEYNGITREPLPRIVCICDEYADLLLADKKRRESLETQIARLGSKARAAGIHLIFATQRPSRDIVKGVIDANFSGRVALKVGRSIESRIILDEAGGETLLGKGDLLYRDVGSTVRLQGLLVGREELQALAR